MSEDTFRRWLSDRLTNLDADEAVFSTYIISILESEDAADDKLASVEDVLSGMDVIDDVTSAAEEICIKWDKCHSNPAGEERQCQLTGRSSDKTAAESSDLKATLANITDCRSRQYAASRAAAAGSATYVADQNVKAAILAQYSQVDEDGEEAVAGAVCGSGAGGVVKASGCDLGVRNVNVDSAARTEREQRERQRQSAAAKKEKDKEDRERQKKAAEDRRKKAQDKAAKGERRR